MDVYRVKIGAEGSVMLPNELRDKLGLVEGDTITLTLEPERKFRVETSERTVGPLSDFFEDLILGDLRREGCSGDILKNRLLQNKLQLSAVLDRMAEEARRVMKDSHCLLWREASELSGFQSTVNSTGPFSVFLTPRCERDLRQLSNAVLSEVPPVFEDLEQEAIAFKRLKGPYYETYRISFRGPGLEHFRILYTVWNDHVVTVLIIGERRAIYERLKGMAC